MATASETTEYNYHPDWDKTFFTADTHFGHRRVMELDERPWDDINKHDEDIICAILDTVPSFGTLYHLGDVGYRKRHVSDFLDAMASKSIKVILIRGNHDKDAAWKMRGQFHAHHESIVTEVGGSQVHLSHWSHRSWDKSHYGAIHFHGHSHGQLERFGRSADVGTNATLYTPPSFASLVRELTETKCCHSPIRHAPRHLLPLSEITPEITEALSGKFVRLYSEGRGFWRPKGRGYTLAYDAGAYLFEEACAKLSGLDPDRGVLIAPSNLQDLTAVL